MKIACAICNSGDMINSSFFWNFNAMFKPKGYEIMVFRGNSRIKSAALNEITMDAFKWGADYIFYMDYDIAFPQDTLIKLLAHNLPVVGGLYHLKNTPYAPVAGWTFTENGFRVLSNQHKKAVWKFDFSIFPDGDEHGLVEVEWTGIGCLLVKREVFDKIGWKKKKFYDVWDYKTGARSYGHDVNFCFEIANAGMKVYVDRTVNCGHTGALTVDEDFVRAFYKSGMNMEWIKQARERKGTVNYWDRMWGMEDVNNTTRTYPSEFDFYLKNINENSRVADVGCGIGFLLKRLKDEKKCDVYGYDFSPVAIEKLKEAGINGEVQNLLSFQFSPELRHDVVILSHVLEHFETEQHETVINVLKGLCKHGGKIFIGVPMFEPGYVDACLEHKVEFNANSFKELMEKHFKSCHLGTVGHTFICVAENE